MKKSYLNIFLSILIIAALSAAIVSAEHHPVNEQNNQPDKGAASASLVSVDYHRDNNCRLCHNHGGDISNLNSISKRINTPNNGPKKKQQDMSVASVSLTSTEYHHVDGCTVCHDMSGKTFNLYLVFEVINTPNSGPKDVIFTTYEGTNSYADGDTTYNGVCEVCHTETRHHRNDGNNPDPDSHYANTSCRECHVHIDEFSHGGGSGSGCEDCHGHDPRYEYEPDKFSEGAGTIKSHSTHTENDNDDLKGPNIPCDACHDIDNYPYFKSGTGDAPYDLTETNVCAPCHSPGGAFDGIQMAKANWDDGIYEADSITIKSENEKWCASCHDGGVAFSRAEIIDPVIVDNLAASFAPSESAWPHSTGKPPFNGPDVQYHAAGGDGSATATWAPDLPNDGVYNVYAMWTSYWNRADNTPYTIHYTGDGGGTDTKWVNQQQEGGMWVKLGTYPFLAGTGGSVVLSDDATGGSYIIADAVKFEYVDNMGAYAPNVAGDDSQTYGYYVEGSGHGLTCTVCHDASAQHIDHNQRTYEIDETTCDPGPCVVVNSYEDGYRLSDVAGQRPMVIPKESVDNSNELDPAEFALCFKCHDSEPILSLSWDDTNFKRDTDPYERNFHQYHLGMQANIWDSDWDAVINGIPLVSVESMPSCTACHNVHGSPSATMTRHGELISTPLTTDKVPSLDFSYLDSNLDRDPSILLAYPDSKGGSTYFRGYPERGNFICRDCHGGFIEPVYRLF